MGVVLLLNIEPDFVLSFVNLVDMQVGSRKGVKVALQHKWGCVRHFVLRLRVPCGVHTVLVPAGRLCG